MNIAFKSVGINSPLNSPSKKDALQTLVGCASMGWTGTPEYINKHRQTKETRSKSEPGIREHFLLSSEWGASKRAAATSLRFGCSEKAWIINACIKPRPQDSLSLISSFSLYIISEHMIDKISIFPKVKPHHFDVFHCTFDIRFQSLNLCGWLEGALEVRTEQVSPMLQLLLVTDRPPCFSLLVGGVRTTACAREDMTVDWAFGVRWTRKVIHKFYRRSLKGIGIRGEKSEIFQQSAWVWDWVK